jgi:hypothetical protein
MLKRPLEPSDLGEIVYSSRLDRLHSGCVKRNPNNSADIVVGDGVGGYYPADAPHLHWTAAAAGEAIRRRLNDQIAGIEAKLAKLDRMLDQ